MLDFNARELMGESKFYEGYSRWDEKKGRYENWGESVERVMNMHREFYKDKMTEELEGLINEAEKLYKDKRVLGAQRALQFGGEQLLKHQMRLYNCLSTHASRVEYFGELFYCLLCGAGVGFSIQKHHVEKLPKIQVRKGQSKIHKVTDDIEGWATSLDVLMSSFFVGGGKYPEYEGKRVYFDTSEIRDKGSFISGGFKAPGPEPLRRALDLIENMLNSIVLKGGDTLRPIHVYDISMYAADAVLAGGVRRSATICLFSPDDEEMLKAKTGNWFSENPQRGRSNNSAVIVRKEATPESFNKIMGYIKQFGEPGFVFVEDREFTFNPCVEIGKYPVFKHEDGTLETGFQGCNLTEINGAKCIDRDSFLEACRASAIIGTLQAGYTNFKFVSDVTKKIFERESLIGCSITGWMNSPNVLLDEKNMRDGAILIKKINRKVAKIIGINPAARTTCVKPSGNASVILSTTSATSAEHSEMYIRNVQMNKEQEVAKLIRKKMPYMVQDSVWSTNKSDYVISFPVVSPEGSVFKKDVSGIDMLEIVKKIQQNWIEYGTDESLCVDKRLRHNVSNTINIGENEWEDVEKYIFENRSYFAGVSLLSKSGDKDYNQAPMTQVKNEKQIAGEYGPSALFASGLIVDTFSGFDDLWQATQIAQMDNDFRPVGEDGDQQAEWIRRFEKFADNYFDGDKKKAEYCLKDVYLLHRWVKIQQNMVDIDFSSELGERGYTDIDTTGAAACAGPVGCEI